MTGENRVETETNLAEGRGLPLVGENKRGHERYVEMGTTPNEAGTYGQVAPEPVRESTMERHRFLV